MHDDEPATKKSIIDEPDDDVDVDVLVFANPGVGVLLPGKDGCQNEDRASAAPEVFARRGNWGLGIQHVDR